MLIQFFFRYPNYKFNPKKKTTKTRAYRKRTEEVYTAQEFAQQQKLAALYHEGMKSNTPPNPTFDHMPTIVENVDIENKEDICCATCYSSAVPSNTCFSSKIHPENFPPVSSQSVSPSPSSPYTVSGFHEDLNNLDYAQLYPPHHYYGSNIQPNYPYESSLPIPSIQQPYANRDNQPSAPDYYTAEAKNTSNARRHDFSPLIHTTYNGAPLPTILSPFFYHQ